MPDFLINGSYPQVYWNLPNVDESIDSYELWWSSAERPAIDSVTGLTSEILEIDFGRKRSVNYLSFDVTYKPVDITVEYDEWSFSDSTLERKWKAVKPINDERGTQAAPFDNAIFYVDGANVNPWFHAQFFFSDKDGLPITAQRMRITFTRRIEGYVFDEGKNFNWSVDVQNLRTARYVIDVNGGRGILVESGNWDGYVDLTAGSTLTSSREVWQNFRMPGRYIRSEKGGYVQARDTVITEMVPSMTGVGFYVSGPVITGNSTLIDENGNPVQVKYEYSLHDVTSGRDKVLASGEASGEITNGAGWIDAMFPRPIATSSNGAYQLRVKSQDVGLSNYVYTKGLENSPTSANPLKSSIAEDTTGIDAYVSFNGSTPDRLVDTAMLFRIWADIGEAGRDVFGNEYREGLRRDVAENVSDSTIQTNWVSGPNPDPGAVEALYFDVRTIDDITGKEVPSVVDTIRVKPITPGVYMNVYYSNDSPEGEAPDVVEWPDGWEGMRWTPIIDGNGNHPYVLMRDQTIHFPRPVRASWICLEFSSLQPLPFKLPELTDLPPIKYKRFPDFLYGRLNQVKPTHDDMNVTGQTSVSTDIFSLYTTISEFETAASANPGLDKNYLRSMALRSAARVATAAANPSAPIDPKTLAQIFYSGTQMYYSSIPTQTNTTDSVLGQYVSSSYSTGNRSYSPTEIPGQSFSGTDFVSNVNERSDQSGAMGVETVTPIWWSKIERHHYDIAYGKFRNQKAYYAGIAEVEFLRKNFSERRDDPVIHDILGEGSLVTSPLVEFNTWRPDVSSRIAAGQGIWLTYSINDISYSDFIMFESSTVATEPNFDKVLLSHNGGRANGIVAYSGENNTGDFFVLDEDYTVIYDSTLKVNYVQRSTLHQRFTSITSHKTADARTTFGVAVISSVQSFNGVDAATATGVYRGITTEAFTHAGVTTKVKLDSGTGVMTPTAKGGKIVS
jgi:hypothetical protein